MGTQETIARLWNLCHVLRDDGITYHEYVTELTFLLFLKMAQETGVEKELPAPLRWGELRTLDGAELLTFYRDLLRRLGSSGPDSVKAIYQGARTSIKQPAILRRLITEIDSLRWHTAREEGLGDMYEGLLEKNATEKKSGAGQYFTPRPLIESIVALVKPRRGEVVEDPACGTGGFLIAANEWAKRHSSKTSTRKSTSIGVELVEDARRLAMMNMLLHGVDANIELGDALSPLGANLPKADIILSNPPFGTKRGGGLPSRTDLPFKTGNKQLAFLQHIYLALKPGGRAAVIVPDNVLFEGNVGADVRKDLMDKCALHTILRLPPGIFYAQGIKTNVLFFTRGHKPTGNTRAAWIYDLRTDQKAFGKRTPLQRASFKAFEQAFGEDPTGNSPRKEDKQDLRWRKVSRDDIQGNGNSLDFAWLRSASTPPPRAPQEVVAELVETLASTMGSLKKLQLSLDRRAR